MKTGVLLINPVSFHYLTVSWKWISLNKSSLKGQLDDIFTIIIFPICVRYPFISVIVNFVSMAQAAAVATHGLLYSCCSYPCSWWCNPAPRASRTEAGAAGCCFRVMARSQTAATSNLRLYSHLRRAGRSLPGAAKQPKWTLTCTDYFSPGQQEALCSRDKMHCRSPRKQIKVRHLALQPAINT